jgi:N-6 DNA Methylase
LIYTDGNAFSLWRDGNLQGEIIRLEGSVETAGAALTAPASLLRLFRDFLSWTPIPPRSALQLAEISARLCRLLRDEVIEQMDRGSAALTGLAADWRRTLFPDASNETFADGYAQAVTFGLLMARAQGISLADGLDRAARRLRQLNLLIGTALRVLTDDVDEQATLTTSLDTMIRVLDVIDWATISKGEPEAWLYFYEHFLSIYDNALRRRTGSYYTPPEIVTAMVRLVDEALRDADRFGRAEGLASSDVRLADPAMGTGTFLLGVLQRIAAGVAADQGEGAVPGAINASLSRLIGFEIQFGPFAVAQLRLTAEVLDRLKVSASEPEHIPLKLYLTDTLGNPNDGPQRRDRVDVRGLLAVQPIKVEAAPLWSPAPKYRRSAWLRKLRITGGNVMRQTANGKCRFTPRLICPSVSDSRCQGESGRSAFGQRTFAGKSCDDAVAPRTAIALTSNSL